MKNIKRDAIATVLLLSFAGATFGDVPLLAPVNTSPGGQTYGQWAAEWWQWALGVPGETSPLLDTTGEYCDQRQVGDVWFLAGSFGTDPVERDCTVPAGKSLFFPLINNFYGAFVNDPPETRTEEFLRALAQCPDPVTSLSAWVDGFRVPRVYKFLTGEGGAPTTLFNIQLPPGNVFGVDETIIPELVLSPSAQEGYYLFLRPLSPGLHTIRFYAEGCFEGFSQDVTYNISVQ